MNTDHTGLATEIEDPELAAHEAATPITDDALPVAPTARDQRKRERRLDARSWVPTDSVAVFHRTVTIGHQTVRKMWNPIFVRAQTTLHMLQHVVPSSGMLEATKGVEKTIEERLEVLESEIQAERERLLALAKNDGVTVPTEKAYTDPEEIHVPIYTPFANRYLRVIQAVDELYWIVDTLWYQGVIKTEYKYQVINTWKNKLWDFVKFTTQTWIRARKSLREKQIEKSQKATAKQRSAAAANSDAGSEAAAQAA